MRHDAEVLLRSTPGPALTVWHSAAHPCGRAFWLSNFTLLFETEAERKAPSARRCPACSWPRVQDEHLRAS
jgi:hypothetical protein